MNKFNKQKKKCFVELMMIIFNIVVLIFEGNALGEILSLVSGGLSLLDCLVRIVSCLCEISNAKDVELNCLHLVLLLLKIFGNHKLVVFLMVMDFGFKTVKIFDYHDEEELKYIIFKLLFSLFDLIVCVCGLLLENSLVSQESLIWLFCLFVQMGYWICLNDTCFFSLIIRLIENVYVIIRLKKSK